MNNTDKLQVSQPLLLKDMNSDAEETASLQFGADGLIPVVIQEHGTGQVLMVAFMNQEAFQLTLSTGRVHFWSRSRQKLWLKGETSGDYLLVERLFINCEENSLLVQVRLAGQAACHTGNKACYYREIVQNPA